jgi:putative pyruvate formate lyase activating enzyme
LSNRLLQCELCPRQCGVNRLAGERGYCRAGARAEVFRYGPHHGEEPPVSGRRGSGTVFFSRCTMRCGYCQNYPWSQGGEGAVLAQEALEDVLAGLAEAGCHNWNLVSPTPWLPHAGAAVEGVRRRGHALPVVVNTSGFERVETLQAFQGLADLYLVDLRYAEPSTAAEGSDTPGYVDAARAAVREMWRQVGPLRVDADGIAESGLICRLLVLPGRAGEAVANLRWLAKSLGNGVAVSVMGQYHPAYKAVAGRMGADWQRRVTAAEYEQVCCELEALGFEEGWVQELEQDPDRQLLGCEMAPGSGL